MANHDDSQNSVPPPEPELTPGQWLASYGPKLASALVLYLLAFYLYPNQTRFWTMVGLGLSLVIFVHELGHFLVAKWCDVNVTVFSIGFGPAFPGCSYQWGETTYKLAVCPLGGYVQMVGQVDGSEESDGSEDDPRSYRNKSVGQRMAIISAGVVMNVILAVICFIVVFYVQGKDRLAAVVTQVDSRAPAFVHGLPSGAVILQIGDKKDPYFDDLKIVVATSDHGQKLLLVFQRPGDQEPTRLEIEPRKERDDPTPLIGVTPPSKLELVPRWAMDDGVQAPAYAGSAAERARPPFHFEDLLVATTDPDNPKQVKELPLDPRCPGGQQRDYFEFYRRMSLLAGQEVVMVVQRGSQSVETKVPPAFHRSLGVRMPMGPIISLREDSPATRAGVHGPNKVKNLEGDRIVKVTVRDGSGREICFEKETLDPLRLPFQLQQWADQLARSPNKGEKKMVTLHVQRHKESPGQQFEKDVQLQLQWDDDRRFDQTVPLSLASPIAIAELGLAYQVPTTVADVVGNWASGNGQRLQKGDVILAIRLPHRPKARWLDLKAEQWAGAWSQLQVPEAIKEVNLKVKRDKEIEEITLAPTEDTTWPLTDRGLILMRDARRQKADDLFGAIALGFKDTHNIMLGLYQSLRGMFTGRIDFMKNLGGPITIAKQAYLVAAYDFWEFVFFIGFISINLAVINFLPIPVLDGGHMVFLIYEKLRGKPASEGVRVGATYVGLALILGLMVFVTYLDITREF